MCVNLHATGLDTVSDKDELTTPLGIYNGKEFLFRTGTYSIWNTVKTFWRYGFSLVKMNSKVKSVLKSFSGIYKLQAKGKSYASVPDLLKAMAGNNELYHMTQVTARDYMLGTLGWSQKVVDELVTAGIAVNYGQNAGVDAFTAFVSLAGMEDGSLWSVVGGNKLIPEKLLETSKVTMYMEDVVTVTRLAEDKGRPRYSIATSEGTIPSDFDVVIVANPLNISTIKYENFSSPVYTAAATTPYQRTVATFIKGKLDPRFFGMQAYDRNFPLSICTVELVDSPFQYRSISVEIPSEVPASGVQAYEKPLRKDPIRVWKVFSPEPLTEEQKQQLFSEIEGEAAVDWLAYPQYQPPEHFPPFILDDGVFYINAIEKAASAMEMSAIGARNASLLAAEYISKE